MVSHYVNGRPFSREKLADSFILNIDKCILGQVPKKLGKSMNYPSFNGSIDEFSLFISPTRPKTYVICMKLEVHTNSRIYLVLEYPKEIESFSFSSHRVLGILNPNVGGELIL